MTLAANVLLALAALITALVALLVADARQAAGADAMGLVVVPMLLAPRWAAVAVAMGIAARRSALGWIHQVRAVQATGVLAWHAAVGIASFAAVIMAYGPHTGTFKSWAFLLAVVVPTLVVVGTAIALNGSASPARSPATWRLAAGAVSLVVAWGGLSMVRVELTDAREARAAQEAAKAAEAKWRAEQHRKLRELSPQAPLREWLPWLNVTSDEFREPALAAVRSRPRLEQDVADLLRGPDAPLGLRFMWLWMPDPPAALAAPACQAIAGLPSWAERYLADPPRPTVDAGADGLPDEFPPRHPVDLWEMSQAAIVIADKFERSGLDFVTPIRAFAEVLERHALPDDQLGSDVTYQPRAFLREWLEEKPVGPSGVSSRHRPAPRRALALARTCRPSRRGVD